MNNNFKKLFEKKNTLQKKIICYPVLCWAKIKEPYLPKLYLDLTMDYYRIMVSI